MGQHTRRLWTVTYYITYQRHLDLHHHDWAFSILLAMAYYIIIIFKNYHYFYFEYKLPIFLLLLPVVFVACGGVRYVCERDLAAGELR